MKKILIKGCSECPYEYSNEDGYVNCVRGDINLEYFGGAAGVHFDCPLEDDLQPIHTTKETVDIIDRAEKAEAQIAVLVEKLEFYAGASNYDRTEKYGEGAAAFKISKIVEDNGKRARDVLAKEEA